MEFMTNIPMAANDSRGPVALYVNQVGSTIELKVVDSEADETVRKIGSGSYNPEKLSRVRGILISLAVHFNRQSREEMEAFIVRVFNADLNLDDAHVLHGYENARNLVAGINRVLEAVTGDGWRDNDRQARNSRSDDAPTGESLADELDSANL